MSGPGAPSSGARTLPRENLPKMLLGHLWEGAGDGQGAQARFCARAGALGAELWVLLLFLHPNPPVPERDLQG